MHPIKQAIYDLYRGDDRLVRLLGNAEAISMSWPAADVSYASVPVGSTYDNLPATDPDKPRARVTFVLINPSKDMLNAARDDTFQVDVWSLNPELVEEIVQELEGMNRKPLTATNGKVNESIFSRGPDLYESETRIFHTPSNLRVLWNP